MSESISRGKARTIGALLAVTFIGAALGFAMRIYGLAFAPPWTFVTGVVYLFVLCLSPLLGVAALAAGWMRGRELLAALAVSLIVAVFYLAFVGAMGLPTGMTTCKPLPASPPQVRYACVSASSDDANFRYEFTLEGRSGWPLMRIAPSEP